MRRKPAAFSQWLLTLSAPQLGGGSHKPSLSKSIFLLHRHIESLKKRHTMIKSHGPSLSNLVNHFVFAPHPSGHPEHSFSAWSHHSTAIPQTSPESEPPGWLYSHCGPVLGMWTGTVRMPSSSTSRERNVWSRLPGLLLSALAITPTGPSHTQPQQQSCFPGLCTISHKLGLPILCFLGLSLCHCLAVLWQLW